VNLRVAVVCTGNVARSPALAAILQRKYAGDGILIESAAVGRKAVTGQPVKRAMRQILLREGYAEAAEHRSVLLGELSWTPDIVVGVARVHAERIAEIMPDVRSLLCDPLIPDPAFGGNEGYEQTWQLLQQAAQNLNLNLKELRIA
jgi:protein-tyrosine phosphatase